MEAVFGAFSTLSATEKRFHNVHLRQRSLETNGLPLKLVEKRFWRGNDWDPMERFGVERIRSSAEVSVDVSSHFFALNDGSDRETQLRIAAPWKSKQVFS